jgi:hypothetical protein
MRKYITRLTPNSREWKKPSGRDGKCNSAKSSEPLYEQTHGFGWEEWLFKDYHAGKETCLGFLQAFNGQNEDFQSVDEIHLYTRICGSIKPKNLYIGYIKDIQVLPVTQRAATKEQKDSKMRDLKDAKITDFPTNESMWQNCFNIQFERKNVILLKAPREINLEKEQFRFSLYDLSKHNTILTQINH